MNKSQGVISTDNEELFGDEVGLIDLVAFVRRNIYILLSGTMLGCILGLVIAITIPAQWEATALLRIGQLGTSDVPIEPSLQTVDRIKNKSFQNDVLKKLGLSTSEDDEVARDFRDTLKVKLEKSSLVNLAIRGASPEAAKQNMSAVINEVISIHTKSSEQTIQRWQEELTSIQLELKRANAESERLVKSLDGQTDSLNERSFSQTALLSNILLARETELKYSRDRKRVLEEQLSPERTFLTKEIGRVEVSEKPVFPKKSLFAAAGFFLGLLIALLLCAIKSISVRMNLPV